MSDLPVGHRVRRSSALALRVGFVVATVFAVVTVVSKEIATLNAPQPWQDDPYDVLVSLDFAILPLLVVMGVVRLFLCRRDEPLPSRRVTDLLRVSSAALAVCLFTEVAEWVAVALGRHRGEWNVSTTWQILLLALLTVSTVGAGVLTLRAARAVDRTTVCAPQPDWLSDLITAGLQISARLGATRASAVIGGVDRSVLLRVRHHPVGAACGLVALLASPYVAAKVVLEGYPLDLVFVITAFVAACMFALVIVAGSYLRVVAPRRSRPSTLLVSAVAGCVCGATLFAFHDSLLRDQTVSGLALLLFGGGFVGAVVAAALHWALRRSVRPTVWPI
jgi:hypothetical protein